MAYGTTIHSIGATAISTYAYESGHEFGIGDLAGEDVSLPYVTGYTAGVHTLKGRDYPLYLTITGREADGVTPAYSRERYLTNVQGLGNLLYNSGATFTLTRVLVLAAGTQTCTITARYKDGYRVNQVAAWAGRVSPVLTLLDAAWSISGGGTTIL